MHRKVLTAVWALVLLAGSFSAAYALRGYLTSFNTTYGTTGTVLNTCGLCHTNASNPSGSNTNVFADDYANNNYSFPAIANRDSDGDGYTNIAEITAATFPGDATSHPSAADTTAPVVSSFAIPVTSSSLTVAVTSFTATDATGVTGYLLTETSAIPAATAAGWSASAPATYVFATAGSKTLYAWAKDAAGNVSIPVSRATTITLPDTTAPVVSSFTIPVTSSSLTVAITAFTATDATGVTGYLLTETSAIPAATAIGWSGTPQASYTFSNAGSKTLYAWAKDGAGNVSVPVSRATTVTLPDTTAPVVSSFTIPVASSSLSVAITAFTATDAVGVTGYMVTETSATPAATGTGWSVSVPPTYVFLTAGSKTLYAWAKDGAGNVSVPANATTTITLPDTTPPVVNSFTIPATSSSLTVAVTSFTATDAVGVTGYMVTETSATPAPTAAGWSGTPQASYSFATPGVKTLYAWAKDGMGNVSIPVSGTTTINLPDTTAPVVNSFTVPATSVSLTVPITVLAATDNVAVTGYTVTASPTVPVASSAGWTSTAPTSYTFPTSGAKILFGWAKDGAGNISVPASATTTITLPDTMAPAVSAFIVSPASGSLTVPVTTFTAADNVAVTGYMITETSTTPLVSATGWSATPPASYTFAASGSKTLYGWAKDGAGNISVPVAALTTVTMADSVPPVVTSFIIPMNGTILTVPITAFTAADNVAVTGYMITETSTAPAASATTWNTTAPVTFTLSGGGVKTLYAWVMDAAGNVSAPATATVNIAASDVVAPVITTFTIPSTAYRLTVPVTGLTATDNVGVTGYLLTETSTRPGSTARGWRATPPASYTFRFSGTKALYAWAKDAAGNVSTAIRRTVSVRWSGPTPSSRDDDERDDD
jgi:hypothetical protein